MLETTIRTRIRGDDCVRTRGASLGERDFGERALLAQVSVVQDVGGGVEIARDLGNVLAVVAPRVAIAPGRVVLVVEEGCLLRKPAGCAVEDRNRVRCTQRWPRVEQIVSVATVVFRLGRCFIRSSRRWILEDVGKVVSVDVKDASSRACAL